jgi:hypothetical protein
LDSILNRLYFYYSDLNDSLIKNSSFLGDTFYNLQIEVESTFNKLKTIRGHLVKKDYTTADNITASLKLDQKIIQSISSLIEHLKQNSLDYDLNIGEEQNKFDLLLDKFTTLPLASDINSLLLQFNNLQELIRNNIHSEVKPTEFNYEEIKNIISELATKSQSLNLSQDELNTFSKNIETISEFSKNILSIDKSLLELKPRIIELQTLFNSHLDSVKTDFTQVIISYKEQTINSVNSIKASSLEASKMIIQELPDQIKSITDSIPEKITTTIDKSLWMNLGVFGTLLLLCMMVCIWFMGKMIGHTVKTDIVNDINSRRAAAQVISTSNKILKH